MLNQLTLMGRLTRDVEVRHTQGGKLLAKGGIAVDSYAGKDQDGKARKRTLFLDFTAFEKTGENIAKHFKKGEPILLVGELEYQTWESEGQKRSKHAMIVLSFSFIPGSGRSDGDEDDDQEARDKRQQRGQYAGPEGGKRAARNDGDVPF